jgi:hypothetical protein
MCETTESVEELPQAAPVRATLDPDEFPPGWSDFAESRRRALESLKAAENPALR